MCLLYVVLHIVYITCHIMSQENSTTHRRVKHIGAWSPGLAPHPGEASPGDGPNHEGVGKTLKHHHVQTQELSTVYTTYMHYLHMTGVKNHMNKTQRRGNSLELMNIEPEKTQGNHIDHDLFCAIRSCCLFLCC